MNTGEREYTQGGQRKKFDQTNKWKFTSLESSIPVDQKKKKKKVQSHPLCYCQVS